VSLSPTVCKIWPWTVIHPLVLMVTSFVVYIEWYMAKKIFAKEAYGRLLWTLRCHLWKFADTLSIPSTNVLLQHSSVHLIKPWKNCHWILWYMMTDILILKEMWNLPIIRQRVEVLWKMWYVSAFLNVTKCSKGSHKGTRYETTAVFHHLSVCI